MINNKILRSNIDEVINSCKARGIEFPLKQYQELESNRKKFQVNLESLKSEKNTLSKQIAKANSDERKRLLTIVNNINEQISQYKDNLETISAQLDTLVFQIPNLIHENIPVGSSENDNVTISEHGTKPKFDFTPKEHHELSKENIDLATAASLSGSRFMVLKHKYARLHRALAQYMLDKQIENGYTEIYSPLIVNEDNLFNTGNLPKFAEDLYKIEGKEQYLIPTGEVILTNLHKNKILATTDLPKRYVTLSSSFRKESGSYGKDTVGILRQHQFEKVELVSIVNPQDSFNELERMVSCAMNILDDLGLHYRKVELCSFDIGFSATKTYDLEVWLPGQSRYREISSCSNCSDFQARRMQTRIKNNNTTKLVHTLNGSGLAVGRTMIAVLENYQQADGTVLIPKCLKPYMGNIDVI